MDEPARGRNLAWIVLAAYLLNPVWAKMFFAPIGVVDLLLLQRGEWFATRWSSAASVGAIAALVCSIGALCSHTPGYVRGWMSSLALVVILHCWGMRFGLFGQGAETYNLLNAVVTIIAVVAAITAGRPRPSNTIGDVPSVRA